MKPKRVPIRDRNVPPIPPKKIDLEQVNKEIFDVLHKHNVPPTTAISLLHILEISFIQQSTIDKTLHSLQQIGKKNEETMDERNRH